MLARPEIGTREHVLLWLASKPPEEKFYWPNPAKCACGRYSEYAYGSKGHWMTIVGPLPRANDLAVRQMFVELNSMAQCVSRNRFTGQARYGSFGALYALAREQWADA